MTTFLINDSEKVIVPANSKVEYVYVYTGKIIVISRLEDKRMFGGSFVKLYNKENYKVEYVSSTLTEDELKKFVSGNYKVDINNLYRSY